MAGKLVILGIIVVLLLFLFVPAVRSVGTDLLTSSETLMIDGAPGVEGEGGERSLELVTLLGFDAIPAILDPEMVDGHLGQFWMQPDEQVLGLSINGDNRAYPIKMLSRHEIVNDVVGGVPVAVTW